MKPRFAVLTALFVVAGCHPSSRPGVRGPATAEAPRVLMTIVVDQLPAWLAEDRWPALPADGGFARLRREGLTVTDLRYAHANTETAPGHAALYTGAPPRDSGIVQNDVPGPDGKPRSILIDEATKLVDVGEAESARPGSSLARLRSETLADSLVAVRPGAPVYSFSIKDRGALFGGGRRPTAVLWLDVAGDAFATSTAFAAPPAWAVPLADRAAVTALKKGGWTLSEADRAWVEAHATTADAQDGEGDLGGMGRELPHAPPSLSTKAMRATPLGDRALFALAGAALKELAARPKKAPPALLALSLSSHDYVSHVFGPDSWEEWAAVLELDRRLAALFAEADRAVGPEGWAAILTSDHGGGALPEVSAEKKGPECAGAPDKWERPCGGRRRISPAAIAPTLNAGLAKALGGGPWVAAVSDPFVYLAPHGHALVGDNRRRVIVAAKRALAPLGIADVVDVKAMAAPCPNDDSLAANICRSIDPKSDADLYLVVAPGAFFDPDLAPGSGTNHGSPYLYDRAVPLIVRAPGRVKAGAVRTEPVSFASFTRTAASLLGIRPPAQSLPGDILGAD
jgi:hypothetical protein